MHDEPEGDDGGDIGDDVDSDDDHDDVRLPDHTHWAGYCFFGAAHTW